MPQSEWENLASLLSIAIAMTGAILLSLGAMPRGWITRSESSFKRLAAAPLVWFFLFPAISFMLNVGIAIHHGGIPHPKIHDEFSYLLAGDTFASGRLTNPSPNHFEHFETPQEIVRPTRMSKYPPGQGLAIALGQVLTGMPIAGIWISTAAACAAIYWMLLGFVSKPWALLGGILATVSPTLIDWSQVYWGGNVAVLGGALLLGGWGRLMLRKGSGASVMMTIGLAILANSRPFEGLMVALPLLIALLIHARKRLANIAVPGVIVLGITIAWMGYYNHRVTGNALRLPFAEYTAQYDVYPKFWFEPVWPTPQYRNRSQQWVHTNFERGVYDQLRTVSGFFRIAEFRAGAFVSDNLKLAALFIPFAAGVLLLQDVRIRWVIFAATTLLLALLGENFDLPHYAAPATPVMFLLVVVGLSRLWRARSVPITPAAGTASVAPQGDSTTPLLEYDPIRAKSPRRPFGQTVVFAILLGFSAGAVMCLIQGVSRDSQIADQQSLVNLQPALHTGRHIIFVEYGPMTELVNGFANEYVYNRADLNDSRIIWVRSFGPDADRQVVKEYPGRKVWLLNINKQLDLKPYLEQR
jgi:hypothetical protein